MTAVTIPAEQFARWLATLERIRMGTLADARAMHLDPLVKEMRRARETLSK